MKRKLIISSIILVVIALLAGLFWAYKTGKLAGLADVIQQEQYDFGAIISVKYEDGSPASEVDIERCWLEEGKTELTCQNNTPTNPDGEVYFTVNCSRQLTYGCPGYMGPAPLEILYTNFRPVKSGYCSQPSYIMLKTTDEFARVNYLDFILKLDGRCGVEAGKGSVSGFVYNNEITDVMPDGTGRYTPIAGARISVRGVGNNRENVNLSTDSKTDGTFEITNIPPGPDYDFTCSKEGFGTVNWRRSIAASEEYFFNIGMEFPPPPKDKFTLLGRVSNSQSPGNVISDATVLVLNTYAGVTYSYGGDKTNSDTKYNMIVKDIPLKPKNAPDSYNPPYYPYQISISHPEFEVFEHDFGFKIEQLQYEKSRNAWVYYYYPDIMLTPRATFKVFGNVTESAPIPGLVVRDATIIVELYKGTEAQRAYTAITDKKGNYMISEVAFNPYLSYYFKVENPNYREINQGPIRLTEIPMAIIEGGVLEPALKKDFILDPGGIDCKKILREKCPSCPKQ